MYVYMLAALQSNYFVTERWQRIRNASSNALGALREARNNSIAAEQRHNFGKRRCSTSRHKQTKRFKTNNSWTHKFYCLSGTDQDRVPSSTLEKNALVLADLGEKKSLFQMLIVILQNLMKHCCKHSLNFSMEEVLKYSNAPPAHGSWK